MSYFDFDDDDNGRYDRCCNCGSEDTCASAGRDLFCGECWREREAEKAARKAAEPSMLGGESINAVRYILAPPTGQGRQEEAGMTWREWYRPISIDNNGAMVLGPRRFLDESDFESANREFWERLERYRVWAEKLVPYRPPPRSRRHG